MVSSHLAAAVVLLAVAGYASADRNCSTNKDGRNLECFTCLGRDLENCQTGLTCCKGSCYKLIDITHNIIVKGCTSADEEDASMKVRELDVPLYWANDEKVKGESYFCNGHPFCNTAPSQLTTVTSLLVAFCYIWIR